MKTGKKGLTLVDLLDGADHVVHEILQIAQRVGDTGSLVHLGKGSVKDGDDVFEQLGRDTLRPSVAAHGI